VLKTHYYFCSFLKTTSGINYVGQEGELRGCHNDVWNMKEYIMNVHGFKDRDIRVLMDDGENIAPTKANILSAYKNIVAKSVAGDAIFCHFAGKFYLVHIQTLLNNRDLK
jgi:hypothetical protein